VCWWLVEGRDDGRLMLGMFCGWSVAILTDDRDDVAGKGGRRSHALLH
jgi:hypothetical protein